MSGLIKINDVYVNLPPTSRSLRFGNLVLSNQRAPTDMFGAVELTFSGLKVGTDVVILKAGTNTVLDSVDQNSGDSYKYLYFTTQLVDIGFIKAGYVPLYFYNYPLSNGNVELPIQQIVDRNYPL